MTTQQPRLYVAIPWRDNGDQHRLENRDFVIEHLFNILGESVHLVDSDGDVFSAAAARNAAVTQASEEHADVVVICDADAVTDPAALVQAVHLAAQIDRVVLPFSLYRSLPASSRDAVISGFHPHAVPHDGELDWSVGMAYVTSPSAWRVVGGMDPRFTGWGFEDTAFDVAARKLGHPLLRIQGVVFHLWHPVTWRETDATYQANKALLERYAQAPDVWSVFQERAERS